MEIQRFPVELTADDLEVIEMGLHLLQSQAARDGDGDTTEKQIKATRGILEDAQIRAEEGDVSLDAERLSLYSDVDAWNSLCASSDNPQGRRRNSEHLQNVVNIHRPTTTEKGHN